MESTTAYTSSVKLTIGRTHYHVPVLITFDSVTDTWHVLVTNPSVPKFDDTAEDLILVIVSNSLIDYEDMEVSNIHLTYVSK